MTWEDPELVADFLVEAEEHLDEADAVLLDLERSPRDPELQRRLNGSLHTLKGMATYVDFGEVEHLCHAAESLIGTLASSAETAVSDKVDCMFQAVTVMRRYFGEVSESLDAEGVTPDAKPLRRLHARIEKHLPRRRIAG